jgi:SAM-dependent methyltransferase
LGDACSIVNVGAGTGSYEPRDRDLVAVELSEAMIHQRARGSAPVVQASASALPFADKSVDATMALLTIHHWPDQRRGLREMARIACKRCVILTWIPGQPYWLNDYFPEILQREQPLFSLDPYRDVFEHVDVRPVPVPFDCTDGFLCAYWRRPEAYFDPGVRGAISSFAHIQDAERRLEKLRRDLDDGTWKDRNKNLLDRTEGDFGYRLVVADLNS